VFNLSGQSIQFDAAYAPINGLVYGSCFIISRLEHFPSFESSSKRQKQNSPFGIPGILGL